MISCSMHRGGATLDFPILLIFLHVCLMFLPLTLAEEFNNEKMTLVQSMGSNKKSMCLRQLESPTPLKIRIKMHVRPKGAGSNYVHIAGAVDVPTEELEVGGNWAPLYYEYTSFNQELYLNMTLKGKPLIYTPNRPMYRLRYDLEAVKMHVKGRVEIIDTEDCTQLETTTTTTTTTTLPAVVILSNPAAYTVTDSRDATSWVSEMGAAGSVRILTSLAILLVLLVVVVASVSVILWRRRKAANNAPVNKDPFAVYRDPLMPQPHTADQFSTNNTNVSPVYRSPPPPSLTLSD